jgi:FxLD family lantipeptide
MSASTIDLPQTAAPASKPLDLDLDVRVVESGAAASVLLGSTDDGCDTVGGSDC